MPALSGLSGLGEDYKQRVLATQPSNLVAYYMLNESSGTTIADSSGNARNGTATGFDWGQTGSGDGRTAAGLDGTNDKGDVFSTSLRDAFSSQSGSTGVWFKPAAGVLTDGTVRYLVNWRADGNNRVSIRRTATNNGFAIEYVAGGTTKSSTPAITSTDWTHLGITWDKAADEVWTYLNGFKINANALTGLGTWVGALAVALIGANSTTPTNVFSGSECHIPLWSVALSPAEMAFIGRR